MFWIAAFVWVIISMVSVWFNLHVLIFILIFTMAPLSRYLTILIFIPRWCRVLYVCAVAPVAGLFSRPFPGLFCKPFYYRLL